MSTLPTRGDLFAAGRRAVLTTPNVRINPNLVDVPGSDINLLIGAMSVVGEEVVSRGAACMRGGFADTAREDQLDRWAFDRYGMARLPATAASVDLTFTRPGVGAGAGTLSAGLRVQTAQGVQFALDGDVVFGALDLTRTGTATSVTTGVENNVPLSTVTALVDPPFDPTITVTNPAAAAGGTDVESDPQFRGRIRGFFQSIRRGIIGAIEWGATEVPGVAVATANEITNPSTGYPAAFVELVIGDRNGNSTSAMRQAVADSLLAYRAGGIPVNVLAGTVFYQTVQWALTFVTGTDESLARSRVRAVCAALGQFLPPGQTGTLYRADLIAAAKQVPGIIVSDSSLISPAGDVVPANNQQMIRIRQQDVTA
jgi:uncharacterized phage protein gp47/JayE